MDQKLLILVTYHAKPGRGREFLREIEKHGLRETILKEDGCLRYDYYLASDTDDTVLLCRASGRRPRIRACTWRRRI